MAKSQIKAKNKGVIKYYVNYLFARIKKCFWIVLESSMSIKISSVSFFFKIFIVVNDESYTIADKLERSGRPNAS